jgi:hypothetical protein
MSIHAKSSSSSPPPLIVNNLSSPKMWWWMAPKRKVYDRTLLRMSPSQLWLAIHSGSLKRLTKQAQPAHVSCFIPFLDIASNNKIKAYHSRRDFLRLLFKSVEWKEWNRIALKVHEWIWMVSRGWNHLKMYAYCTFYISILYHECTYHRVEFWVSPLRPSVWGIIWNLGFGWEFLPTFDILYI